MKLTCIYCLARRGLGIPSLPTSCTSSHLTTPLHFLWSSSNDPGPVSVTSVTTTASLSDVCGPCPGIGGGSTTDTGLVDAGLPPAAATTGNRRRGRAEWPPPIAAILSLTSASSFGYRSPASRGKTARWAMNGSDHKHDHSACPWPPYTMASHVRRRPAVNSVNSYLTRRSLRAQAKFTISRILLTVKWTRTKYTHLIEDNL